MEIIADTLPKGVKTVKTPKIKKTDLSHFSNGLEITDYTASAYAEGFCEGEGASDIDQLKAWAYLIKTGLCWSLQGRFGRIANSLIQNGIVNKNGTKINWNKLNH